MRKALLLPEKQIRRSLRNIAPGSRSPPGMARLDGLCSDEHYSLWTTPRDAALRRILDELEANSRSRRTAWVIDFIAADKPTC
jgi:hypothetical protein